MIRSLLTLALLALLGALIGPASAQLTTLFVGPGTNASGPPPVPCGVGVIDLSTGCPQAMLGVF